jgi:ribosome production factor 2
LFNRNKKRPNNLTFGRLFNWKILEMHQFGVVDFVASPDLPQANFGMESRPLVLFRGDQWDTDFVALRSVLIDFFVGDLKGPSVIQFTRTLVLTIAETTEVRVLVRHYQVDRGGSQLSLTPVEPAFDLVLRRKKLPNPRVMVIALPGRSSPGRRTSSETISTGTRTFGR